MLMSTTSKCRWFVGADGGQPDVVAQSAQHQVHHLGTVCRRQHARRGDGGPACGARGGAADAAPAGEDPGCAYDAMNVFACVAPVLGPARFPGKWPDYLRHYLCLPPIVDPGCCCLTVLDHAASCEASWLVQCGVMVMTSPSAGLLILCVQRASPRRWRRCRRSPPTAQSWWTPCSALIQPR